MITNKYNNKVIAVLISCLLPLTSHLLVGCSDEWNSHYDVEAADNGTLWQAISAQDNLGNFTRVVKACGYDIILDGSQTFSVFAPTDDTFTTAQADSMIDAFQKQQAAGVRSNDNTIVRQFIQNHISLYRHPVSSLTGDSIKMMNGKYEVLTSSSLGNRVLSTTNALCNNGLLFTVDRQLDYFPNVFEYLGHDQELDSVYQFLNRYSVYEFNDAKSVPGEIVDGMTIYLDSVSDLRNSLLETNGLINSEDSTYWMVCPTNSEWSRLLAAYEPYFNYSNAVAKRDSMIYANTRMAIVGGTIFSRTQNPDAAFNDSAVSTKATAYSIRRLMNEENAYYIYKKPFDRGGIFYGTDDIVCSNGHVRKANQFNVSKYDTFLQTVKVEAESILSQDTIIDAVDPLIVREVTSDNPFYGKVSGNSFVEVVPDPATAQVTVRFKIPNILSNVSYDIYGVFAPVTAYDVLATEEAAKPNLIRSILYWDDQNGRESLRRYNANITTNPAVVDTVLLVSDCSFPTCSYGLSDAQVKLAIRSNVSARQTATHSNTLRIDCLIIKPREQ